MGAGWRSLEIRLKHGAGSPEHKAAREEVEHLKAVWVNAIAEESYMKKPKKTNDLDVLVALRSALERARATLGDALPLAHDQGAVRLAEDVDRLEREVIALLNALENHWPTVDPSGRCQGCERCGARGVN